MPDTILDTSGLTCPLPVLKAKKAMSTLGPGDILDFEAFCVVSGHTLLSQSEAVGVYRFKIAKGVPKR
jgi:tRNA 2-thiouridine synthesizing protein A